MIVRGPLNRLIWSYSRASPVVFSKPDKDTIQLSQLPSSVPHTISQGQIRSEDVYQETYTSEAGKEARPVRAAAGHETRRRVALAGVIRAHRSFSHSSTYSFHHDRTARTDGIQSSLFLINPGGLSLSFRVDVCLSAGGVRLGTTR